MENLFLIVTLALGLAMDAFAVAVAQGAAGDNSMFHATRTGIAFGVAQGVMPFLGWELGAAAVATSIDAFAAGITLPALGLPGFPDNQASPCGL